MRSLSTNEIKGTGKSSLIKAVRILAAVALLILANTLKLSDFLVVILSIASALVAGFDIVLNALAAIGKRDYFNYAVILLFAVIVGFAASCSKEATLLVIMYQVGSLLLNYAMTRSKKEMLKTVTEENGYFDIDTVTQAIKQPGAMKSSALTKVAPLMDMLLKAALIVGILYAVIMPLISDMTFVMSIRRGLMLILAASPAAAMVSLPLCSEMGIAFSTLYGTVIKDASVLEKLSSVKAVVFDKNEVFSDAEPKLSSISSPILDSATFKALAAYIAYNSQLRIAAPILAAYKGTVVPEYIEKFSELPGDGMEIMIHGVSLCIMTREIFELRGIEIPEDELKDGFTVYMAIGNKYAGRLTFKENINPYAKDLISDLKTECAIKTILLSEDSENSTADFAAAIGVDEYHYGCTRESNFELVESIKSDLDPRDCLVYVSAEKGELHSAADIDVRSDEECGDMSMTAGLALPAIQVISKRVMKRQKVNIIAMLALKLILIIMALTGSATMWFIVFAELVLASGTVLIAASDPRAVVGE